MVLRKLGKADITQACLSLDLCDRRLLRARAAGGHTPPAVVTGFRTLSILLKRISCRWALHVSSLKQNLICPKGSCADPKPKHSTVNAASCSTRPISSSCSVECSPPGLLPSPSNRSVCFLRGCSE